MSLVIIQITLLSGRYHAHVWGEAQHAMAGPEWPPSPWRVLRTIAACWFDAPEPPCTVEQRDFLLETLGRAGAPRMWLPAVSFSELPLYQPLTLDKTEKLSAAEAALTGNKTRSVREPNSRVLHFDHFAVVAFPDIYVVFEAELTEEQQSLLAAILATARYFGRAESRALFRLAAANCAKPHGYYEVQPASTVSATADGLHRAVLVPTAESRASDLWQVRPAQSKASSKANATTGDLDQQWHPGHLVEALIKARRPIPDGTEWVQYWMPRGAILPELPRRRPPPKPSPARPAAELRFQLFRRVPIPISDTVLLARDFRDQAVKQHTNSTGQHSLLLSGREHDGSVARGRRHAYYLPQPDPMRGFIDHMFVRLPGGEEGVEQEVLDALLRVNRLFSRDPYPVLVVAEEVMSEPASPPTAKTWRSITPFLGPLRQKSDRKSTEARQQLLDAIRRALEVTPEIIESEVAPILSHLYGASQRKNSPHYRFTRRAGISVTLEFSEPVQFSSPIGADAHFGLGQFRACA